MKKGLIFATTLAMALGVGVAVGAHQEKAAEVKAAGETTLYLDTNKLTWYGDQSRAYLHGSGGDNQWPGQALTHVSGSIYKLDIPDASKYQNVIFLRSNGTDVWNRTSKHGGVDINLPTNWATQNMWKFGDGWDGNEYDDGNYTGSWQLYTPPASSYTVTCHVGEEATPVQVEEGALPAARADQYDKVFDGWYTTNEYSVKVTEITADCDVYGRFVNKPAATYTIDDSYMAFSSYHLYAWNEDGNIGTDFPGIALEGKSVTVPTDAQFILSEVVDKEKVKQTVDISQEGAKSYLCLYTSKDEGGNYQYGWAEGQADVPAEEGYHFVTSKNGFVNAGSTKMLEGEAVHDPSNNAEYYEYEGTVGEKIQVRMYERGREAGALVDGYFVPTEASAGVGKLTDGKFEFTAAKKINIFAKWEDTDFDEVNDTIHFYVAEYVEPEPEATYSLKYNGLVDVDFAKDEEDMPEEEGLIHQYSATLTNACRGNSLVFYKNEVQMDSGIGVGGENNNVVGDVTNGFKIYRSHDGMKVYLKEYSNGGYSIWGSGYAEPIFYAAGATLTLDQGFEPVGDYVKQFKSASAVALTVKGSGQEYDISDNDGYSQRFTVESVSENNAVTVSNTKFNVHNACSEVIYLKMKADLSLWLYIGGYEEAHVLTIGGQNVALSKGEGNQYVAHGVALSAGDEVTAYTIEGEPVAVTSKKVANNNLKEDKTILANVASADIYYDTIAKNLWISGLPAAGQHLLKNGNTAIEMHHTDPFGDYEQYASGMLTFAANDTIKVINTGAANDYAVVWCPEIVATSKDLAGKFVYDSEKQEMKCVTACSAAVYLKIKAGVDEVYFGDVPEYIGKAIEFANGFKSAMATACSAEEEGKQAAVKAAWELQATAFAALEVEVKDELKLGETSLVDEVIEFGQRYAGIYKQLGGKYELADFLESGIVPNVRFYTELGVTGDNSAMIIVISIAAASALAFTLLLVFKKKKQK